MLATSFPSELHKCTSFCASFHLLYSAQFENCTIKVSNELCPSNFGGFIMCFGEATSSSDEPSILASDGGYGSSSFVSLEVLLGVLVDRRFL